VTDRREFLAGVLAALAACSARSRGQAIRGASAPPPSAPSPPAREAAARTLRAQRLAWAGVRLELDSASLWIDPLLNADVWGAALRDPLVPVRSDSAARYVLVTHRHPDHFDPAAIQAALGDDGTLVCTLENAALAAMRGFRPRVAQLHEPVLLADDFTATAVPAVDGYGDPQVSWIVTGGGRRIIHCGDTLWHGAWWHIGRQYGPFDAAFLPINGARFAWRKPVSDVPAVLTPEQAVAAAVVLGARLLVPIHYGVTGAEGYAEQPDVEPRLATEAARRGVAIQIVQPGEWVRWR
jgi:L-ascorbate metabolism protein UlaG (beta-lactamase superfamily)